MQERVEAFEYVNLSQLANERPLKKKLGLLKA